MKNNFDNILVTTLIIPTLFLVLLLSGCSINNEIKKCNGIEYNNTTHYCQQLCPNGKPNGYLDFNWEYNNIEYSRMRTDKGTVFGYPCYDKQIRSYIQDEIDANKTKELQLKQLEMLKYKEECYRNGTDYNYTFDIIKDYNFSCKQLSYINDHLINTPQKVDEGYISGYYSGFLSGGHIEGHAPVWINTEILATGNLVKTISYRLDCVNDTHYYIQQTICEDGKLFPEETSYCTNPVRIFRDTKKITLYTESDFVMYYVQHCISE